MSHHHEIELLEVRIIELKQNPFVFAIALDPRDQIVIILGFADQTKIGQHIGVLVTSSNILVNLSFVGMKNQHGRFAIETPKKKILKARGSSPTRFRMKRGGRFGCSPSTKNGNGLQSIMSTKGETVNVSMIIFADQDMIIPNKIAIAKNQTYFGIVKFKKNQYDFYFHAISHYVEHGGSIEDVEMAHDDMIKWDDDLNLPYHEDVKIYVI